MVITSPKTRSNQIIFDGRSASHFLSNFFIEPDRTNVQSEFQAAKFLDPLERMRVSLLPAARAKMEGHRVKLREGWETERLTVMEQLVMQKFLDHPNLQKELIATGSAVIVKRSHCISSQWGQNSQGQGANLLGQIIMKVRDKLK